MSTLARMTPVRRLALTGTMVLGAAGAWPAARAAATLKVLSFVIDDTMAVRSDGNGPYMDFRVPGAGAINYCVDAALDGSGGAFIRLNRKLDGDAGYQYCGMFGGTPRQFTLSITDSSACNAIANMPAPCSVTGSDKPRIRLDNVFASKPSKTPLAFLILSYDESINYVVRTDADATVTQLYGDPDKRAVTYSGTARVWQGANTVGGAFSLPLHIDFVRSSVP